MRTMNSAIHDALVSAGADETRAREAAKSAARYDPDSAEMKASPLWVEWMAGITPAFVGALAWRVFR